MDKNKLKQSHKYPFCSPQSFYLRGHFIPVRVACPKCGVGYYDGASINPRTGICYSCGFNVKAMGAESFAKLFGYEEEFEKFKKEDPEYEQVIQAYPNNKG